MEIVKQKDVLGKNWLKFWNGNFQEKATNALLKAKRGNLAKFEGYCPTFKGTMKYWEVSLAPLMNDYGSVQWILVTSRDMTKYKIMQKEINKLNKQLDLLKLRSRERSMLDLTSF